MSHKYLLTESVLQVRFASNDKRTKQTTNYRRRRQPDTLWRNLSNPTVLQKTPTQEIFAEKNTVQSKSKHLSSYRSAHSNHLRYHSWHKQVKQNKNAATKRDIPKDPWDQRISLCEQFAKISETFRSKSLSRHQSYQRPVTHETVLSPASPHQYSFGLRFNSSHNLRQTDRRSQSWLQSGQKRETLIPPVGMFRISYQRFLAWSVTSWRCIYGCRGSGISARMPGEDTTVHLPNQSACGFRVLRPQVHRTFRRKRYRLRGCGKTDRRYQEKASRITVSQIPGRLVSGRIPVYANEMGKASPVCCYPQKASRETRRATDTVHSGTILIPDICHQPAAGSTQCLVLLQRESIHRNSYQRTERRFLLDKDTNKQFPGKPGVFLFTASCLQYNQLVQTTLSARPFEKFYAGNNSQGYFGIPSKVDKVWQQECSKTASCPVFTQSVTESDNSKHRDVKDRVNLVDLLKTQNIASSIYPKIMAYSRFF